MVERVSWAVSHSPGVITTVDARHTLGSLWTPGSGAMVKRVGRVPNATEPFKVLATSPTPDGLVHVNPGYLVSMGTRSIAPYNQALDAIKDINILSTPAHGSLTRWDLIIAQQNDELHSDADNTWTIKQVAGNPSASPSDPTVTGSPDYVVIARVVVPPTAAVNGILQANVTQLLTAYTVPVGSLLPVADQTARTAIASPYEGMPIYRVDRDWVEVYDGSGSGWRVQGTAVVANAADLSAITSPYEGQLAYNTALTLMYQRKSGAWHLTAPITFAVPAQTGSGSLSANTTATIASVSVPDYGVPIKLEVAGQLGCTTPATGNPFSIQGTYDSTVWDTNRIDTSAVAVGLVVGLDTVHTMPSRSSAQLASGARTVRLLCKAGPNAITVGTGNYNFGVRVLPALP